MERAEFEAVVIGGNRLGRTLGFPTANMEIAQCVELENGVYRSQIEIDGLTYRAMSNVGVRPSVDGKTRLLETHVFDFHGDLYGKKLKVTLCEKIRDERKFATVTELREQLEHDMEFCKTAEL